MAENESSNTQVPDPLQRNRVPSYMTGAEFRAVAEVLNEGFNDLIAGIRQLEQSVIFKFTEHDETLRAEVVKLRQLCEQLLGQSQEATDGQ